VRIPVYLALDPSKVFLGGDTEVQASDAIDRLLKAGLRAQLNMQSLITGQLRVDLDLQPGKGPGSERGTADMPIIPSVPSQLQTLEDEIAALPLKQIADNARQTLTAIQHVADDLAPKIGPLADSVQQTAAAAHVTLDDIDRLSIAGEHQLSVSGNELAKVLASADRTARQAEALAASLRDMTAPDSRMRADLRAAVRDLADSASSLRSFTHQIAANPSTVLLGRHAP
jgi:paraquat-inducible protein B